MNARPATNLSIPFSARECRWDYTVGRPEKGGAGSIPAAEAARAAGVKPGLGNLVPGFNAAPRKGECGRNYMCPGFESRRFQSWGRSSVGRAMFPLGNLVSGFPLSPDRGVFGFAGKGRIENKTGDWLAMLHCRRLYFNRNEKTNSKICLV